MITELGSFTIDLGLGGKLTAFVDSDAMSDEDGEHIPIKVGDVWDLEAIYKNGGGRTSILEKDGQRIRAPANALPNVFNWEGKA